MAIGMVGACNVGTRHSTAWGDGAPPWRLALHTVLLLANPKGWVLIILVWLSWLGGPHPPG